MKTVVDKIKKLIDKNDISALEKHHINGDLKKYCLTEGKSFFAYAVENGKAAIVKSLLEWDNSYFKELAASQAQHIAQLWILIPEILKLQEKANAANQQAVSELKRASTESQQKLKQQLANAEVEIMKLQTQLTQSQNQSALGQLLNQSTQLQKNSEVTSRKTTEKLQAENEALQLQLQQALKNIASAKAEKEAFKQQLSEMRNSTDNQKVIAELQAANAELQSQLLQAQANSATADDENKKIKKSLEQLNIKIKIEAEIKKLEVELKETNEAIIELQDQSSNPGFHKKSQQLNDKLCQLKVQKKHLKREILCSKNALQAVLNLSSGSGYIDYKKYLDMKNQMLDVMEVDAENDAQPKNSDAGHSSRSPKRRRT